MEIMDAMTYKGHVYGLPRLRSLAFHTLTIRKDWLDKLRLKMPTTYDELYDVSMGTAKKTPMVLRYMPAAADSGPCPC
ncbi:hypothetical protein ACFQ88_23050 [Paenibacillus sp. NPDC056579]|uniref:hypothetical protein n=1 Tax=Paenibacillus sp. NPDC056579 TaxID=3345871 RepID=UPI003698C191